MKKLTKAQKEKFMMEALESAYNDGFDKGCTQTKREIKEIFSGGSVANKWVLSNIDKLK